MKEVQYRLSDNAISQNNQSRQRLLDGVLDRFKFVQIFINVSRGNILELCTFAWIWCSSYCTLRGRSRGDEGSDGGRLDGWKDEMEMGQGYKDTRIALSHGSLIRMAGQFFQLHVLLSCMPFFKIHWRNVITIIIYKISTNHLFSKDFAHTWHSLKFNGRGKTLGMGIKMNSIKAVAPELLTYLIYHAFRKDSSITLAKRMSSVPPLFT